MAIPQKIGKYEISEQIGVGGFGAVYRARDPFIKRTVAVKTCQLNDEEIKSRFFREAELAGNLHHRNITTIFDFGVEDGIPYIVQEFLTGEDLDKIVKRGDPLAVARKVEILMAIAEGLAYAHRASIIHRDIKPSNIRILEDGSVKIMDFGIAKSLLSHSSLTQTGITLGTSAYLAPEQIRGEALDQRTDVFALGILAYELLTYRKPFRGEHLSTVLYKILNESPEPIETLAPDVPPALAEIIHRSIEKGIDDRYPSMEALGQDLMVVYRELAGSSARFSTMPRTTHPPRPSTASVPVNPDQTRPTPGQGVSRGSITPPSGALARVPSHEDHTPTVASAIRSVPAGLELVDFRDPSQRAPAPEPGQSPPGQARRGRTIAVGAFVLVALGVVGVLIFLSRGRVAPAPRRVARPIPTVPLVFPTPQLGRDAIPVSQPTAAPPVAAGAAPDKAEPEPNPPARRFKVQITSLPMSTLWVDGRKLGASIPVRTVELAQGTHVAKFEHPDFSPVEKEIRVGSNGAPPLVYRFPIGYLVIDAPAWTGANVLIDSKFKGVVGRAGSFPVKAGAHRVTLSREGTAPYTAEVTVPEGEKQTWTPPPPVTRPEGTS